ncbi:MAG: ABC transporter permease [Anaerolineae bacterium]|nr:ABC transporter permease [Anaerolineae bacterium]MDW8098895.1 ABC transporter permease [Anaerolineae bacterium]
MAQSTTQVAVISLTPAAPALRHRSLWRDAARRFFKNRLAILGLAIVLCFLFLAIFADWLAPYPYDKVHFDKVLLFPFVDPNFPLGTDEVGRDYLSRLIYGARTSMTVGISVQLIALSIGVPLGALAGFRGGRTDFLISRLIDVMTAFPGLLFAIFLITVFGGGLEKVILILGVTSWLGIARLMRGQLLSLREKEYIEAARCIGASEWRIIWRHLLPNAISPLLVAVSFGIPAAIFGEAGLSFLGIGINDPLPSWGKMVGVSSAYVRVYWHLALFPTILIALTMLGFTFMGDGLRDALDPRLVE